ncbi:MAG: hypothetical protein AAF573_22575 [Bacteroidota bacterium]
MRRRKKFPKKIGVYFFEIKMGYNNTITIFRKSKKDAIQAFKNYIKQKKDIQWLGKWDGKKFIETDVQFSTP